jgi:hypothetical protein
VFGFETMLTTLTFVPPSWDTRLPQKFSAATTRMVDVELEGEELELAPGRPERKIPAAAPPTIITARIVAIKAIRRLSIS